MQSSAESFTQKKMDEVGDILSRFEDKNKRFE